MKLGKKYRKFFLKNYANTENAHLDDNDHELLKKTISKDFNYDIDLIRKHEYLGAVPEKDNGALYVFKDCYTKNNLCFRYKNWKPKAYGPTSSFVEKHVGLTQF